MRKPLSAIVNSPDFKRGQLHRDLGIAQGQKIPLSVLRKAAERKDKTGERARFAMLLERKRNG